MKTLKQFEKANQTKSLDEFLNVGDQIDESLYHHIACGYVPVTYSNNGLIQGGDPEDEIDGVYTYSTANCVNDKYYYLGILPEFKTKPDSKSKYCLPRYCDNCREEL